MIQLILIVACAQSAGILFRHLGQPQVCGEIIAGLLLGPSFFGVLWPSAHLVFFDPASLSRLTVLGEVGLIFMMFLIGVEFDFGRLANSTWAELSISMAGVALSFLLGVLLRRWICSRMKLEVNKLAFILFIATALSIAAVPVLARIMIEFNPARTRISTLAFTGGTRRCDASEVGAHESCLGILEVRRIGFSSLADIFSMMAIDMSASGVSY